jgi:hypothetical protein
MATNTAKPTSELGFPIISRDLQMKSMPRTEILTISYSKKIPSDITSSDPIDAGVPPIHNSVHMSLIQ